MITIFNTFESIHTLDLIFWIFLCILRSKLILPFSILIESRFLFFNFNFWLVSLKRFSILFCQFIQFIICCFFFYYTFSPYVFNFGGIIRFHSFFGHPSNLLKGELYLFYSEAIIIWCEVRKMVNRLLVL